MTNVTRNHYQAIMNFLGLDDEWDIASIEMNFSVAIVTMMDGRIITISMFTVMTEVNKLSAAKTTKSNVIRPKSVYSFKSTTHNHNTVSNADILSKAIKIK